MRGSGGDSRENAGISNEKAGAIPARRKPKVSRVKAERLVKRSLELSRYSEEAESATEADVIKVPGNNS